MYDDINHIILSKILPLIFICAKSIKLFVLRFFV